MEVISSIYNSGYNIKKFYLGSRELNLAYLGNQVIYDEVIGDNDLNYILYEFYGSDTLPNTVEAPVKSAILKGSTKYRDIDTGEVLDAFEDGRNLELVSVKMPVLKISNKYDALTLLFAQKPWNYMHWTTLSFIETFNGRIKIKFKPNVSSTLRVNIFTTQENKFSNTQLKNGIDVYFTEVYHIGFYDYDNGIEQGNGIDVLKKMINNGDIEINLHEDGYKTNILSCLEPVELGSVGEVKDELNLLTQQLTQRTETRAYQEGDELNSEFVTDMTNTRYKLAQEVVKTVDLTIVDQDGKTINKLNSFNGTTHVSTEVAENSAYPMVSLEVASELQAAMSKVAEDIELIKPVQNDIETTIDTQSNDIDSLLLATTELFEMFL